MKAGIALLLTVAAGLAQAGPLTDFGAAEIRKAAPGARVALSIDKSLGPEAFRIRGQSVTGGDERGVMYGALDYAEQLRLTGAARDKELRPSLGIRALKFNIPLPGTGYLSEEDLANNQWFWSFDYWQAFLDMCARNRYNAITFWSAHPYDRMTRIPKYPEATDLPPAELDRNIAFFTRLFRMAAERGLDVYLVTWNIHVSRAFARRHNIAPAGFDSPLVRDYQREAIKALFATYPNLTGLGTTVGERMPNMTARQKLDWVADTYFAALRSLGRPVPFILRYWQSEPAEMARMLETARPAGPVYLDIKFNGEHMYSSSRPHVEDSRWVALARGHWRLVWHLRNDDLFILRWGDPDFIREAVGRMGGADSAGFVEGSELDVPGPDRIHTPAARSHLDWQYKFEKHWFRYMLWGRLGYDAAEPDSTWRAHYTARFGRAGAEVYEATHQAGKILPLVTAYHWNYMNGDWYPEGGIGSWNTSHEQPRVNYRRAAMYHDVRTWIFNNTIDASFLGIPDFVRGKRGGEGPLEVAARLEGYAKRALALADQARPERGLKEFECTRQDLEATGALGLYYASKLRGATELARLLLKGEEAARPRAVRHLETARDAWQRAVSVTAPHYITHEVWLFGQFDWKRYLPDVEADIRIAREARPFQNAYDAEGLYDWLLYSGKSPVATGQPRPVRVAAASAVSVTEPMRRQGTYITLAPAARQAAGESITGARDFISPGSSALYRIEVPAPGAYELWADCWWPERGAGFAVLVDESNTNPPGVRFPQDVRGDGAVPLNAWTLQKINRTFRLGAGPHTVRFFGRQPGARMDRFVLVPAGTRPDQE